MLDPLSEIPDETEPLPFPADARDSIIDKDQPEVLRLLLTEGIEAPHRLTNRLERVAVVLQCAAVLLQVMQTFLGQGEKNVVLASEVAVNSTGAVLDLFSDLTHRDVRITLGQKERACRVQDGPSDRFPLP